MVWATSPGVSPSERSRAWGISTTISGVRPSRRSTWLTSGSSSRSRRTRSASSKIWRSSRGPCTTIQSTFSSSCCSSTVGRSASSGKKLMRSTADLMSCSARLASTPGTSSTDTRARPSSATATMRSAASSPRTASSMGSSSPSSTSSGLAPG